MKKKHRNKKKHGRRNAAPVSSSSRSRVGRGEAPQIGDILASVAGGAGGALLGGLAVTSKALTENEAGLILTAAGGATAWFGDGHARIVGNSVAAAGAGQLAAAYMHKRATQRYAKELAKAEADKTAAEAVAKAAAEAAARAQVQAALPSGASAKSASGLSNSAEGGGYLADLFRGAASELEMLEPDDAGVDVFQVEDLAA